VGFNANRTAAPDGADSEFAATVATLPPMAEASMPVELPPGGDSAPAADLAEAPTLQHIGRYAVKNKLGEGGLGTVYEAWDPLLSRSVAVKTLQFDLMPAQRAALDSLFLNEARAVAGLSHPHIVTIHDAGLSAHGVYIAMERLEGRDLRQAIAGGWRPTPSQAAQLVRRVADALAYAHARGVVHCDIKPANIFLTRRDRPTVLDFGIARVAHGAQGAAVPALEGLVAGSPHYLAPEQLEGGRIDARTDVYALGVVLYELLAGRKAFDGDSLEQIINAVLYANPAPANEINPLVPPGLAGVAMQAMTRDPAQRYASATALAQALRPWQDRATHEDTLPPLPGHDAELEPALAAIRRVAPRSRALTWTAGAALLLGLAGAGWAWRQSAAPAAPATVATVPTTLALPPADTQGPVTPVTPVPPMVAAPAVEPPAAIVAAAQAPATLAAAEPKPTTRPAPAPRKPVVAAPPAPAAAPAMGQLQLAVTPWGEVEVNGRAAGITPPLAQLELTEGSHEITIRNGDFPPYTTRIQVHPDKPAVVRHRFGS
jgi:eukaryotic-like serine/threonine-protein kinase